MVIPFTVPATMININYTVILKDKLQEIKIPKTSSISLAHEYIMEIKENIINNIENTIKVIVVL